MSESSPHTPNYGMNPPEGWKVGWPGEKGFYVQENIGRAEPSQEQGVSTLAERHPDWPALKLHYELSPHGSEEDFAFFPEQLAGADIYLKEGGGQDADKMVAVLQDIADIDPATQAPDLIDGYITKSGLSGTANEVVIRALYGSHKAVGSIDLRGEDMALATDIHEAYRSAKPNYALGDYETVRDDFAAQLDTTGTLQRQREKIMETQFEDEIERVLTERPELKNKPEITVLATMGSLHTSLYNAFARSGMGINMSRNLPGNDPYVFRYQDQLKRNTMHERGEASEDIKDKAYVERVITEGLLDENMPGIAGPDKFEILDLAASYSRQVASKLTPADARTLFSAVKQSGIIPGNIDKVLTTKGLDILPSNTEELRQAVQDESGRK